MEKLFTRNYMFVVFANFLIAYGFWLLIPVLPFYLKENYGCEEVVLGFILSCYTVSEFCVRPFSGYLMDSFPRKPIFILCYFICSCIFLGYILAGTLTMFIILRTLHGVFFGGVSVGSNTLVVDVMPSSRRGEGLGYYGLTNNFAMALGPMTGLFIYGHWGYQMVFVAGLISCIIGMTFGSLVKTKVRPPVKRPPVSLDRFILIKGLPVSLSLLCLSIPYGATTNYVAMYAQEIGITAPAGYFFTFSAVGMGISRIFAGKKVDKGYVTRCIKAGCYPVVLAFTMLGLCNFIVPISEILSNAVYLATAFIFGFGFGIIFPAMNSLYINLAPKTRRATATSTYLTAWDVGLGIGIATGGLIAHAFSFYMVYIFGAVLCVFSLIFFTVYVTPHYERNKVQNN